jgi:hypothetical protein
MKRIILGLVLGLSTIAFAQTALVNNEINNEQLKD